MSVINVQDAINIDLAKQIHANAREINSLRARVAELTITIEFVFIRATIQNIDNRTKWFKLDDNSEWTCRKIFGLFNPIVTGWRTGDHVRIERVPRGTVTIHHFAISNLTRGNMTPGDVIRRPNNDSDRYDRLRHV